MSAPAYVISQAKVHDPETLAKYNNVVVPTLAPHGGKVLGFCEAPVVIEGDLAHPRTVLLEFPSQAAFQAWYNSKEYQEILDFRLNASTGTLIAFDGLPT